MRASVTKTEYGAFQKAFAFLNSELFGGELPDVLVTLQRRGRAHGYFWADCFEGRDSKTSTHEIALNPATFSGQTDAEIISTLAHEMVHLWQHAFGNSGRRGYHNKQWARKMREIGLQPSDTGRPGGKETGESVSHYILPDGRYARAFRRLEVQGIRIHWHSKATVWSRRKTKFMCPQCGQTAWGKASAQLLCGFCKGTEMVGS